MLLKQLFCLKNFRQFSPSVGKEYRVSVNSQSSRLFSNFSEVNQNTKTK